MSFYFFNFEVNLRGSLCIYIGYYIILNKLELFIKVNIDYECGN